MASGLSLACLLGRLVRFTACLCLCLFSSFVFLLRRKTCTRPARSFEDGLSDFAWSLRCRAGKQSESKPDRGLERIQLDRDIFASYEASKLNTFQVFQDTFIMGCIEPIFIKPPFFYDIKTDTFIWTQ